MKINQENFMNSAINIDPNLSEDDDSDDYVLMIE